MARHQHDTGQARDYVGFAGWFAIGAGIGAAFGVVYGNIALGVALGVALGAIIGSAEEALAARRKSG